MKKKIIRPGLYTNRHFLKGKNYEDLLHYCLSLPAIWEKRYSPFFLPKMDRSNPDYENELNRTLLRPVYWPSNWQFACFGYYRPPHQLKYTAIESSPYPPFLKALVFEMEKMAHHFLPATHFVKDWELNSCLINYYGDLFDAKNNKWIDQARVGEHRDFELGPVVSLSLGEKALFQFIKGGEHSEVIFEEWLDNGALQFFSGPLWKDQYFHRIQRVDRKQKISWELPHLDNYRIRRINLTFRFVPREHWCQLSDLPKEYLQEIKNYLLEIQSESSGHFKKQISFFANL